MLKTTIDEDGTVLVELYDDQGKFRDEVRVAESPEDWSFTIKTGQNVGVEVEA